MKKVHEKEFVVLYMKKDFDRINERTLRVRDEGSRNQRMRSAAMGTTKSENTNRYFTNRSFYKAIIICMNRKTVHRMA